MSNAVEALHSYRRFLEGIPLDRYRSQLKDVKWVEQDLDKAGPIRLGSVLLPQNSIFRHYWVERNFLDFDTWFEAFWQELHSNPACADALKQFKKYYFDKNNDGWFKLGFKARMYRTWTAVLTQLDFCYMFEHLCETLDKSLSLECSAELDIRGIDVRVGKLDFGIVKLSQRKESRGLQRNIIILPYPVYDMVDLRRRAVSPRVQEINRRKYTAVLSALEKYFVLLKNGFVVFGENYIRKVVENIGEPHRLNEVLANLVDELDGTAISQ